MKVKINKYKQSHLKVFPIIITLYIYLYVFACMYITMIDRSWFHFFYFYLYYSITFFIPKKSIFQFWRIIFLVQQLKISHTSFNDYETFKEPKDSTPEHHKMWLWERKKNFQMTRSKPNKTLEYGKMGNKTYFVQKQNKKDEEFYFKHRKPSISAKFHRFFNFWPS